MHASVMRWAIVNIRGRGLGDLPTLEVGSLNVNGTVRGLFTGPYVGIDMREGRDVDVVGVAAALPFPDERFDVVVSTEMLEHDITFWRSFEEMARVVRPGGHLLVTARGNGFPQHDFPSDYYRFSPEAMTKLYEMVGVTPIEIIPDQPAPGVLAIGQK